MGLYSPLGAAFSIPEEIAYLNQAYMSPQLSRLTDVGLEAMRAKEQPWVIPGSAFFEPVESLRQEMGTLMGTTREHISLIPAVSYGISWAAGALPSKPRGQLLLLAEQFPSNVYPWRARAETTGETVEMVQRSPGATWTDAVLERIGPDTSIVAIPACHWSDGSRVDLRKVREATREVGAALVLDLTQSLGAVPFHVGEIDPDVVVAGGYKWLIGPYSLGYMYVSERWHQLQPMENNWITREDSHLFSQLVDYRDSYEPGARRFDVGERSNFFLVPIALEALRTLNEWTPKRIAADLNQITRAISDQLRHAGWTVPSADEASPHMLGVRSSRPLPDDLPAQLAERGIYVSVRGNSIRISPYLYTREEDVHRLVSTLEEIHPHF